ncbi:FAD-dependent monooxygenase [Kribbella sp. NBC_01505]|uniref:FAD-dependent monooxygenase n=1 Tax=Kribbella sp. NBC_01505 TaxID=2903580 RepID=UPI00386A107B
MGTVIVVGAGIGGVTAAVALQRCGWGVTVLERSVTLGEVGAGISVWPSAVAVLTELGVKGIDQAAALSGPTALRKPSGRWVVGAADLGVELPVMIHRAQLHGLITAEFGPGVTVRTGYLVKTVTQDDSGVLINDELRADLVIAADGLRSVIRSALHPQYAGPRYSGYTAYRGIADVRADDGGETWGQAQRFGVTQLIDGRAYWYATANQPAGQGGDLAAVIRRYGGWHDPIPAILAATDTALQNDIYDLTLPLVPFATGRIALLGDAAHAMTPNLGRGACTAIEDAGALARHLQSAPDPLTALTRYDAERRPIATKLVKRSRQIGQLGQLDNPLAVGVRDVLMSVGASAARGAAALRKMKQSRRDHSSAGS